MLCELEETRLVLEGDEFLATGIFLRVGGLLVAPVYPLEKFKSKKRTWLSSEVAIRILNSSLMIKVVRKYGVKSKSCSTVSEPNLSI